jgi:hypothetical protein
VIQKLSNTLVDDDRDQHIKNTKNWVKKRGSETTEFSGNVTVLLGWSSNAAKAFQEK